MFLVKSTSTRQPARQSAYRSVPILFKTRDVFQHIMSFLSYRELSRLSSMHSELATLTPHYLLRATNNKNKCTLLLTPSTFASVLDGFFQGLNRRKSSLNEMAVHLVLSHDWNLETLTACFEKYTLVKHHITRLTVDGDLFASEIIFLIAQCPRLIELFLRCTALSKFEFIVNPVHIFLRTAYESKHIEPLKIYVCPQTPSIITSYMVNVVLYLDCSFFQLADTQGVQSVQDAQDVQDGKDRCDSTRRLVLWEITETIAGHNPSTVTEYKDAEHKDTDNYQTAQNVVYSALWESTPTLTSREAILDTEHKDPKENNVENKDAKDNNVDYDQILQTDLNMVQNYFNRLKPLRDLGAKKFGMVVSLTRSNNTLTYAQSIPKKTIG